METRFNISGSAEKIDVLKAAFVGRLEVACRYSVDDVEVLVGFEKDAE